jgi:hypothetical protein
MATRISPTLSVLQVAKAVERVLRDAGLGDVAADFSR